MVIVVLQLDLTKAGGCSDNPLSRLISIIKEKENDEVEVTTTPEIIPQGLAQLLGNRYGYKVSVKTVENNRIIYVFKKS
ncbi:hypothetical protein DKAM_0004 [Desulfurococcus amylolyticus 1221n]|uniref:SirA family protein n=1 Tax=Desulfurococcus amylolyticus (strain DSM 18924 / JCM 16383 / VKM B-2413 / 1221n) TaxID=490899 RepID=B8D362_DESA1|nr:hypothetical protein DKAM_0004 [Desulfurococcus amylolyticus 1221n]